MGRFRRWRWIAQERVPEEAEATGKAVEVVAAEAGREAVRAVPVPRDDVLEVDPRGCLPRVRVESIEARGVAHVDEGIEPAQDLVVTRLDPGEDVLALARLAPAFDGEAVEPFLARRRRDLEPIDRVTGV